MSVRILTGDALTVLRSLPGCLRVNCCVSSPPYFGLRDYGMDGQIGLEDTPDAYVAKLVEIFREVRNHLADDGTLWLNLGDSYAATIKGSSGVGKNATNKGTLIADRSWQVPPGLKAKDLIGIPWRVAFALQADGWYLRKDIIWHKPNPMPESVKDRPTSAHEYVFLFAKSSTYHYDADAISEEATDGKPRAPKADRWEGKEAEHRTKGGFVNNGTPAYETRNKRSVWMIATKPYSEAHFATMAPELAETCIKAGCPIGGTVPRSIRRRWHDGPHG